MTTSRPCCGRCGRAPARYYIQIGHMTLSFEQVPEHLADHPRELLCQSCHDGVPAPAPPTCPHCGQPLQLSDNGRLERTYAATFPEDGVAPPYRRSAAARRVIGYCQRCAQVIQLGPAYQPASCRTWTFSAQEAGMRPMLALSCPTCGLPLDLVFRDAGGTVFDQPPATLSTTPICHLCGEAFGESARCDTLTYTQIFRDVHAGRYRPPQLCEHCGGELPRHGINHWCWRRQPVWVDFGTRHIAIRSDRTATRPAKQACPHCHQYTEVQVL